MSTNLIHNAGMGSLMIQIPGKVASTIYHSPTDNCQLWCIASFMNLLENVVSKQERQDYLKEAHRIAGNKALLLVDIHDNYIEKAKRVFGSYIRNTFSYSSTNGSLMCIMLIHTSGTWIADLK